MDNKPDDKPQANPKTTELSGGASGVTAPDDGGIPRAPSAFRRLISVGDKYFFIFLVLVIIGGVITFIALNKAHKSASSNTPKVSSLTDQEISQLKGATTVVGDSQQTLDIQGNSVFEGQVVMRNNLDVAGTLKIGGAITLPSITIGGTASFGQVQINGGLAVTGAANFQGLVSIQKNLTVSGSGSFATLSASQLNVTSLQFTGDITITHHIVTTGSTPSRSNGTALGSGGTASISGDDTAGTITINTGTNPPAGCFITVTFSQRFATVPHVIISPSSSDAGSLEYYTNRSATGFSVCDAGTPANASTYIFDYYVID